MTGDPEYGQLSNDDIPPVVADPPEHRPEPEEPVLEDAEPDKPAEDDERYEGKHLPAEEAPDDATAPAETVLPEGAYTEERIPPAFRTAAEVDAWMTSTDHQLNLLEVKVDRLLMLGLANAEEQALVSDAMAQVKALAEMVQTFVPMLQSVLESGGGLSGLIQLARGMMAAPELPDPPGQ